MNPHRVEVGSNLSQTPENPKKNGHLPRWLRVPAFTARTFLAILATTPGVIVTADIINRIENPSIVYADTPTGRVIEIQRVADCQWNVTVEVTGLRPNARLTATNYYDYTDCTGNKRSGSYGPYNLGVADNSGRNVTVHPQYDFGSYSKIITDSEGHQLSIQYSYDRNYTSKTPLPPTPTALDIQIAGVRATATALAIQLAKEKELAQLQEQIRKTKEDEKTPTLTAPALTQLATPPMKITPEPNQVIPTAIPTATSTRVVEATSGSNNPDLNWLLGSSAAFLAGLALFWRYQKGKRKNPPPGIGGVGGPSNPSTAPNTAPSTGPARPKNPEWVIGQKDFERRWQAAKSKLPPVRPGDTGNEQGYVLDRFKAGMNIVHEVSLENATDVPEMDTRVRAGIEYLIPEIWPDNRILKRFFDPNFNAGLLTPEDLAKTIYMPEAYRNLSSFTKGQKRDVNRIRRTLLHALHPDLIRSEADPKLQDSIDILLIQLNSTWPLINKLLG